MSKTAFLAARIAGLTRQSDLLFDERNEYKTQLSAWHGAFGTTQLTHALARLEKAESNLVACRCELERLRDLVGEEDVKSIDAVLGNET